METSCEAAVAYSIGFEDGFVRRAGGTDSSLDTHLHIPCVSVQWQLLWAVHVFLGEASCRVNVCLLYKILSSSHVHCVVKYLVSQKVWQVEATLKTKCCTCITLFFSGTKKTMSLSLPYFFPIVEMKKWWLLYFLTVEVLVRETVVDVLDLIISLSLSKPLHCKRKCCGADSLFPVYSE